MKTLLIGVVAVLLFTKAKAAGDEPAFEGKTATEWAKEIRRKYTPEAADALGRIGAAGAKVSVPALLDVWNRSAAAPDARVGAAGALARIGPEAKAALSAMTAAVNDEKQPSEVRGAAMLAAVALGAGGRQTAAAIGSALRQDPKKLARPGATALGLLGEDGLIELTKCFADRSVPVRLQLCRGLEKVVDRGTHLLDLLDKLAADDPDPSVRKEAVAIAKVIRRKDAMKK